MPVYRYTGARVLPMFKHDLHFLPDRFYNYLNYLNTYLSPALYWFNFRLRGKLNARSFATSSTVAGSLRPTCCCRRMMNGFAVTGNTSRNNVPNKRLISETFLCAVLATLRSRFCVPDTVLDVPDIIWNILPNIIRHIFLISDIGSYYYQAFVLKLKSI